MSEPSPLDLLMLRIEDINHKTPPLDAEDITTIIAYHRHMRQRKASGEKIQTKATKAETVRVVQNLEALMSTVAPKPASKPLFKLKASS